MTKREVLHFAPANGFPTGTYSKLLRILGDDYDVISIEKFGHNPQYPVDENWKNLVEELLNSIESKMSEPVIGVGHSMGSVLTFLAAYQRPDLFKKVILLDPPFLYGIIAWLVFISKKIHTINRLKEVQLANNRRTNWASREEAEAYFGSKALFRKFDPECFKDYVQYGITQTENGVALSYDVKVESKIYKTNPHNIGHLKSRLNVPGKVILGKDTYGITKSTMPRFTRKHSLIFQQLDYGGHLFPMEYPDSTASLIKEAIVELSGSVQG